MCFSINHTTTKSKYHDNNEDSLFIGSNYIIVADGMGGESNGDIASKIAVDTISGIFEEQFDEKFKGCIKDLMFSAIRQADDNIAKYIDENPDSYGMGTTVLLMVYQNDMMSVAWCGDSRCYTYEDGKLCSLTKDHSYVQELIDANEITVDESFSHPDNNLITRYVGGGEPICEPEFVTGNMKDKEIIVLCSDGLSGYCRERDIRDVLSSAENQDQLPALLRDLAIKHGSDDDITIVTLSSDKIRSVKKHTSIFDWFRRKSDV